MKLVSFFSMILIFMQVNAKPPVKLITGDIILLEMSCQHCQVISKSTESNYSHSGVVIVDEYNRVQVAHANGYVHFQALNDFLNLSKKSSYKILRLHELEKMKSNRVNFNNFQERVRKDYLQYFDGKESDDTFRWNSYDHLGRPSYYCSEFITKLLNPYLNIKIPIAPMDFSENWDFWFKFFKADVPQGELGNSPSTFDSPNLCKTLFTKKGE